MIRVNFRNGFFLSLLALVLLAPSRIQAMSFDSIVVFGGSVSDSGNAFALLGFANRPPYDQLDPFLIPTGPYSKGGNHFSNGATWVEQYANPRGLARSVNPAFSGSSPHATNYAVGGARARDVGFENMTDQVSKFLTDFKNMAPSDALYVIDFGGNDVRDALEVFDPNNPTAAVAVIGDALTSIATNIGSLYNAGARRFLFLNVANIGRLPSVLILDELFPGAAAAATALTVAFNTGHLNGIPVLDDGLDGIIGTLSSAGAEVALLDVFLTVEELIMHPQAYGLVDVVDACITPNVPPFTCKNEDQFLFWDGIHPTKTVQAIFAEEAADVLGK